MKEAEVFLKTVLLKPVLVTPNHCIFSMYPSFNTPDSAHQLIKIQNVQWLGVPRTGLKSAVLKDGKRNMCGKEMSFETHSVSRYFPGYLGQTSKTTICFDVLKHIIILQENKQIGNKYQRKEEWENIFTKLMLNVWKLYSNV